MDIYAGAERMMGMSEAVWNRHANPWSVWTRFSCLPLIVLAIWSRVWVGWWAIVLLLLAVGWTWLNPRVFPPPADYGSWASRAVLGERIWLRDRAGPDIPRHHRQAVGLLGIAPLFGLIPMLAGLIALNASATLAGLIATVLPKMWFCDRMVWLHVDVTGVPMGAPLPEPILTQGADTAAPYTA